MASGATCIAYETVTSRTGSLPLLKPMSEVAGRMSIQVGAHYLEKEQGGRGVCSAAFPVCRLPALQSLAAAWQASMLRKWRSASARM